MIWIFAQLLNGASGDEKHVTGLFSYVMNEMWVVACVFPFFAGGAESCFSFCASDSVFLSSA